MKTVLLPHHIEVPALGQGTWRMGEQKTQRQQEIDALKYGIDLGLTLIDTAEMYGDAESIVGEAIKGQSDKVFIVSKVLPSNATYAETIRACERSLEKMKIEKIDLYLLHWRGAYPLQATIDAFENLHEQGKIGAWGVSNFDTDDMEELLACQNTTPISTNQILYNLTRRGPEYDLLSFCAHNTIPIMAYSPIEQGYLGQHKALEHMAKHYNVTPATLALAWVLRQDNIIAIPKASNRHHIDENYKALDLYLSQDDLSQLDSIFPAPQRKMPLEMI